MSRSGPNSDQQPDAIGLPSGMSWLLAGAVITALATLGIMLYPFEFQATMSGNWLARDERKLGTVLCHVLLGAPLGMIETRLARHLLKRRRWIVTLVMIDVALLALIGESTQLWLVDQQSSLIDLVAVTIGGTAGAQFMELLDSHHEFQKDPNPMNRDDTAGESGDDDGS